MYGGNNQFDGNAAFSGGGFMPSQATQTAGDHSFSPAKNRDSQTLIPLTVKQISEAFQSSDDKTNFLVDGVDVNNVKLVGILCNKVERVTDVSFGVDDGTGRLDCFRWVNEAVDTKEMEAVTNGMYVRVHGHLKGFHGKKQLMAYSVSYPFIILYEWRGQETWKTFTPVDDYNEIAYHFAQVIYVHSYNSSLRKQHDSSSMPSQVPSSSFNTPLKGYQASASNQFPGYSMDGIRGVDKMVLDYLQQPSCLALEKGVHRNQLVQQLQLPSEKISEALESLESEGLIYTTIDEFHYKSTGNG